MNPTRRQFISSSGQVLGGAWLAFNAPAMSRAADHAHKNAMAAAAGASAQPPAIKNFTPAQARDLGALSEQIIPTDDTPGAREAGAVYFMDHAFSGFFSTHRASFLEDFKEFEASVYDQTGGPRFADMPVEHQTVYLRTTDHTRFFGTARFLTIAGYLASPIYGGNKDGIGWKTIGFDDAHVFSPPFGYYDRDYPGFQPYEKK